MNLKDLEMEEIKGYIRAERDKGRSMREIVQSRYGDEAQPQYGT